jgi:hypothetical protein
MISDSLGLSVPHRDRTLARLRKDGHIAVGGHRIEFADLEAIQQRGHFQPLSVARIPFRVGTPRANHATMHRVRDVRTPSLTDSSLVSWECSCPLRINQRSKSASRVLSASLRHPDLRSRKTW